MILRPDLALTIGDPIGELTPVHVHSTAGGVTRKVATFRLALPVGADVEEHLQRAAPHLFVGGGEIVSAPAATGPTIRDVVNERQRRFNLGFDYDFDDIRGVHRIGTTKADLEGWREVTDLANAALNLSEPNLQITIFTNTGATIVTALEWQAILKTAGQVRQVIWLKSFQIQTMAPIPADFASNSYWA